MTTALNAYAMSKDSEKHVYLHNLMRVFAAHTQQILKYGDSAEEMGISARALKLCNAFAKCFVFM